MTRDLFFFPLNENTTRKKSPEFHTVLCAHGGEPFGLGAPPSPLLWEVGQAHRVTGEGLQETPKSYITNDEHGRLLEEHKDYPLRL